MQDLVRKQTTASAALTATVLAPQQHAFVTATVTIEETAAWTLMSHVSQVWLPHGHIGQLIIDPYSLQSHQGHQWMSLYPM